MYSRPFQEGFMKKFLFIILTSAISSVSYADNWKLVDIANDYLTTFWLNVDSIIVEENIRDVWHAQVNIDKKEPFDLVMFNEKIDCQTKSRKLASLVIYLRGDVQHSRNVNMGWRRVVPNTIEENLVNAVCTPVLDDYVVDDKKNLASFTKKLQDFMRILKKQKLKK